MESVGEWERPEKEEVVVMEKYFMNARSSDLCKAT